MMPHPITDQLSAFLDGELEPDDRAAVEAHLPSCEECRGTLAALRATTADLALLADAAPTEQDSWALRSAIAQARKPRGSRLWQAAAAVGSVAAVLAGFIAFSGNASDPRVSTPEDNAALASGLTLGPDFVGTTYNDDTAPTLLDTFSVESDTAPAMAGAPAEKSQRMADDAVDWAAAIRRCEATILEDASQPYAAQRYVVATFRDSRAMFLIYAVGEPVERRELWVMSPGECSILHFSQRAA